MCLNYENTYLMSGSRDQSVKYFDLVKNQVVQRYASDSYVWSVALHENYLLSSGDGFIHFRDRKTGLTAENIKFSPKYQL